MDFQAAQEQKYITMTTTPVPLLVGRLAIPTIAAMLITSVYNLADTYFVSQLGTSASAAVGVTFALMALIQAVGFMFGIGSSTFVSRLLGAKCRDEAMTSMATAFITALLFGGLLTAFGLRYLDPLLYQLGATPSILPYARDYTRYILLGAPYMAANFVLNTSLRGQGSAFYSMIGIMSGGVLNIILDPIFIFVLEMGISGAAIATILSQLVSFVLLLYFNLGRQGTLPLRLRNFKPSFALYKTIFCGGFPSLCRQGLASIAMVMLIRSCNPFGDSAIAAVSITQRVMMFVASAMIGFGQGFQPVCGFNYGAKRFDRVQQAFFFCVKVSFVILLVLGGLMFFAAPQVIAAFRRDDLEVIAIGTRALRLQCLVLPVQSYFVTSNMYLQCIGKSGGATVMAMGRQGLFFLPGLFILPRLFELQGVLLAQPISDICCGLLALAFSHRFLAELVQLRREYNSGEDI